MSLIFFFHVYIKLSLPKCHLNVTSRSKMRDKFWIGFRIQFCRQFAAFCCDLEKMHESKVRFTRVPTISDCSSFYHILTIYWRLKCHSVRFAVPCRQEKIEVKHGLFSVIVTWCFLAVFMVLWHWSVPVTYSSYWQVQSKANLMVLNLKIGWNS